MYANDILLCFKENRKSCMNISKVFHEFERMTNLKINVQKFEINFPKNTSRTIKREICQIFNIHEGNFPFKYLGTMVFPRKLPLSAHEDIVNQVRGKLINWNSKTLS